jgi:hypothetical protein
MSGSIAFDTEPLMAKLTLIWLLQGVLPGMDNHIDVLEGLVWTHLATKHLVLSLS